MRCNIALVTAVFLVAVCATQAKGQTVSIKSIDNTTAGQLTVTATYTNLPKKLSQNRPCPNSAFSAK
jgi:hypothetical protein